MKHILIGAALVLATGAAFAGKPATQATKEAQAQVLTSLPFDNTEDFKLAKRGLIARPDPLIIKGDNGEVIWDMSGLDYLNGPRPDTVNPSLWRQAQLNAIYGLFQVTDRIYQIRGFDLANMTLIEGDTGWIIVDPLTATETVRAAMEVVDKHFGKRPIKAILSTHSHADHFGGIRALANEEDLESGKIRFVALPFRRGSGQRKCHAGNAMGRRVYMFGNLLPPTVRAILTAVWARAWHLAQYRF